MNLILIMAEKANAGRDIAEAIGLDNIEKIPGDFLHGFDDDDNEVVIVHSQGHLLKLKEPEEINPKFKKWNINDLPILFSDNDLREIDEQSAKRFKAIKSYLEKADSIINAGDAGREGELIQRWIIKKSNVKKNIYRLWSSSLTKEALCEAYCTLIGARYEEKQMLDNLYDAGVARAIMDKFMGYNYSRLISLTKTDGVTVNYGRCKSPIINAIIKRDEEIKSFVKKPYSYILASFLKDGNEFKGTVITEDNSRMEFDSHDEAKEIAGKMSDKAEIILYKEEIKVNNPPKAYDILSIQKKMSDTYGYEADETLKICQSLYDEHKMLSYPRTDSRYLTSDLKDVTKKILSELNFGEFSDFVKKALPNKIPEKYFNDKKVIDHHALIPVIPEKGIENEYTKLKEKEKNVYDEIVRSFIALFLSGEKYKETQLILKSNDIKIKVKGKIILEEGYTKILKNIPKQEKKAPNYIPTNLKQGEYIEINKIDVIDTETKPKKHFTTSSLLDYMKIHNIGTGATRDKILKEITERKGHNIDSSIKKEGKYYIATDFGIEMDSLIPEEIKSIDYLSMLDTSLKKIEDGKLSKYDFLKSIIKDFEDNYNKMVKDKEVLLRNKKKSKETLFDCPFCNKPLLNKGWGYACRNWKKDGTGCNYSLPKKIAGKTISDKVLLELVERGRTKNKIKGLKNKKGVKFDKYLIYSIEDGRAKIKFSNE